MSSSWTVPSARGAPCSSGASKTAASTPLSPASRLDRPHDRSGVGGGVRATRRALRTCPPSPGPEGGLALAAPRGNLPPHPLLHGQETSIERQPRWPLHWQRLSGLEPADIARRGTTHSILAGILDSDPDCRWKRGGSPASRAFGGFGGTTCARGSATAPASWRSTARRRLPHSAQYVERASNSTFSFPAGDPTAGGSRRAGDPGRRSRTSRTSTSLATAGQRERWRRPSARWTTEGAASRLGSPGALATSSHWPVTGLSRPDPNVSVPI